MNLFYVAAAYSAGIAIQWFWPYWVTVQAAALVWLALFSIALGLRKTPVFWVLVTFAGWLHGQQIQIEDHFYDQDQLWQIEISKVEPKGTSGKYFWSGEGSITGYQEKFPIAGNYMFPESLSPPFIVELVGTLKHPQEATWPGGYSEKAYFRRKGWVGRLDIEGPKKLKMIRYSNSEKWRSILRDRLLRKRSSSFSKRLGLALIFGEGKRLTKEDRRPFQNTGTAHVLAVSGLHVGMVYLLISFLTQLIGWIRVRVWIHFVATVFILLVYAWFTGMSPSVIRSSLMFIGWALADAIERERFSLNGLWLAAILSLLYEPLWLISPGFHLSYAAVAAILIGFKKWPIPRSYPRWIRSIISIGLVTLFAQIGTLGFSLFYFGIFPVYFFPANLIFTPLIPVLLYGGWLQVVWPNMWVSSIWALLAEGYRKGLVYLAGLPVATLQWEGSGLVLLGFTTILWMILFRIRVSRFVMVVLLVYLALRADFWYGEMRREDPVVWASQAREENVLLVLGNQNIQISSDTSSYSSFLLRQYSGRKRLIGVHLSNEAIQWRLEENIGPGGPEKYLWLQSDKKKGWLQEVDGFEITQKMQAYSLPKSLRP